MLFTSLNSELELVKTYVSIEKARFGDRVAVTYDIDESLLNWQVPPLVIQPLVENALRHGLMKKEDGGHIKIIVSREAEDLVLAVTDDGGGMPPDVLAGLFKEKRPGGGVGLRNINKRLMRFYQRSLTVTSVVNGDNDRNEDSWQPSAAGRRLAWRRVFMLKVVIIDDEQLAINMLKLFLSRRKDVEVIGEYTKPSAALREVAELVPDAVFLDMEMMGMNGINLAQQLKEQRKDLLIVFVTAYRDYAVEAFALNAADYLLKPVTQANVDRAITRLFERKGVKAPAVDPLRVQITSFGQMRLLAEGHLVKWRTAKVEELFAYLLHQQGIIVLKDEIIENIWPDLDGKSIGNNLYTTVYRLKKTLKEHEIPISVESSGGGYIMELNGDIALDYREFNAFIERGECAAKNNIADFERIAGLYQGDYLESKDYFWCVIERTRLQKHFVFMIKQMAAYYIKTGEYKKAEQILLQNSRYWPYDEEAYEILLEVFFLQGDRTSIIKYYMQLVETLQNELGFAPQPALTKQYEHFLHSFQVLA
jgi:two-component SAPR family response regulator